jgi:hypothetical protein
MFSTPVSSQISLISQMILKLDPVDHMIKYNILKHDFSNSGAVSVLR